MTPRIVVDDVAGQVGFLRRGVRWASGVEPGRAAEILIGDSLVMMSSAADREVFPAFLYVYVDDADFTFLA